MRRLCAVCGILSATTARHDCGHFACDACGYYVVDLATQVVRHLCGECDEEGPREMLDAPRHGQEHRHADPPPPA
jgi:hypothetical protein